ncbi:MAG: SRPBCC family protein [Gammaproteobacteria bacterium]
MSNGTDTPQIAANNAHRIIFDPTVIILGPIDNCLERVWTRLTDFQSWPRWLGQYKEVNRLDTGELGRGSQLRVFNGKATTWTITHFDADRRIDYQVHTRSKRLGYSYRLEPGVDSAHCKLSFAMEFQFLGLHALLSPIYSYVEQKRGYRRHQQLFADFIADAE